MKIKMDNKQYLQSLEQHVEAILEGLDQDTTQEGYLETPRRFIGYLEEFCQGLPDPAEILKDGFEHTNASHSMVIQTDIPFRAICQHHLLPMYGHVDLGYIPGDRVVGLSKMTRLVEAVGTSAPGIQEQFGEMIADIMMDHLKARGVMVVIRAHHTCMTVRGVAAPGVLTTTSTIRGIFRDVEQARNEFLSLIKAK